MKFSSVLIVLMTVALMATSSDAFAKRKSKIKHNNIETTYQLPGSTTYSSSVAN